MRRRRQRWREKRRQTLCFFFFHCVLVTAPQATSLTVCLSGLSAFNGLLGFTSIVCVLVSVLLVCFFLGSILVCFCLFVYVIFVSFYSCGCLSVCLPLSVCVSLSPSRIRGKRRSLTFKLCKDSVEHGRVRALAFEGTRQT